MTDFLNQRSHRGHFVFHVMVGMIEIERKLASQRYSDGLDLLRLSKLYGNFISAFPFAQTSV